MKQLYLNFKKNTKYILFTIFLFLIHILFPSIMQIYAEKIPGIFIHNKFIFSLVMIIISLIEMTIFSIIFRKDFQEAANKDLKKDYKYHFKLWLIGLALMVGFNILINIILFSGSSATNEDLNRKYLVEYPIYSIFSILFYAPFCEELIFRNTLKKGFHNIILFSLCSAFLFGSIHILQPLITAKTISEFINEVILPNKITKATPCDNA